VRKHEARFFFLEIRNDGGRTVEVRPYYHRYPVFTSPLTMKRAITVDYDHSPKEFDEELEAKGSEAFVTAFLRDENKMSQNVSPHSKTCYESSYSLCPTILRFCGFHLIQGFPWSLLAHSQLGSTSAPRTHLSSM